MSRASEIIQRLHAEGEKHAAAVHLASGLPVQLALLGEAPAPPAAPAAATARGQKDHDWVWDQPIWKSAHRVIVFCRRCRAQMDKSHQKPAMYSMPVGGVLRTLKARPICQPVRPVPQVASAADGEGFKNG